jgi:RHS repeat-associated protein
MHYNLFSSKERHANSEIIDFGFRYYDAQLQRWLNRDPIAESGGINTLRFVRNNPIRSIDPYGLNYFGGIDQCGRMHYASPSYDPANAIRPDNDSIQDLSVPMVAAAVALNPAGDAASLLGRSAAGMGESLYARAGLWALRNPELVDLAKVGAVFTVGTLIAGDESPPPSPEGCSDAIAQAADAAVRLAKMMKEAADEQGLSWVGSAKGGMSGLTVPYSGTSQNAPSCSLCSGG